MGTRVPTVDAWQIGMAARKGSLEDRIPWAPIWGRCCITWVDSGTMVSSLLLSFFLNISTINRVVRKNLKNLSSFLLRVRGHCSLTHDKWRKLPQIKFVAKKKTSRLCHPLLIHLSRYGNISTINRVVRKNAFRHAHCSMLCGGWWSHYSLHVNSFNTTC